jgi:hypothetical protein
MAGYRIGSRMGRGLDRSDLDHRRGPLFGRNYWNLQTFVAQFRFAAA